MYLFLRLISCLIKRLSFSHTNYLRSKEITQNLWNLILYDVWSWTEIARMVPTSYGKRKTSNTEYTCLIFVRCKGGNTNPDNLVHSYQVKINRQKRGKFNNTTSRSLLLTIILILLVSTQTLFSFINVTKSWDRRVILLNFWRFYITMNLRFLRLN